MGGGESQRTGMVPVSFSDGVYGIAPALFINDRR
jgi:hypothetical protein